VKPRNVIIHPEFLQQALDAEAELWAERTDLTEFIAKISPADQKNRDGLARFAKNCFREGLFDGVCVAIDGKALQTSILQARAISKAGQSPEAATTTGWAWYYTQDKERWNLAGPTRDDAIRDGMAEYSGESFSICEARKEPISLRIDGDWLLDHLIDQNEELLDPDGDGCIFDKRPTYDQERDLEDAVENCIREWAKRHGLETQSWCFAETRSEETIPEREPDESDAAISAAMASDPDWRDENPDLSAAEVVDPRKDKP
jgi:hypothetical protein